HGKERDRREELSLCLPLEQPVTVVIAHSSLLPITRSHIHPPSTHLLISPVRITLCTRFVSRDGLLYDEFHARLFDDLALWRKGNSALQLLEILHDLGYHHIMCYSGHLVCNQGSGASWPIDILQVLREQSKHCLSSY
ncbi:hypothetical protein PENTCL1PPCAC_29692, partial [Pristionchus entomophagus]